MLWRDRDSQFMIWMAVRAASLASSEVRCDGMTTRSLRIMVIMDSLLLPAGRSTMTISASSTACAV